MCTYIHTYIHTSLHTYIHPCIHTYILAYIHTYIHTRVHVRTVCSESAAAQVEDAPVVFGALRFVLAALPLLPWLWKSSSPESARSSAVVGSFGGRGLRRRLCILLLRDDRGQSCLHHCSADHSGGSITDFVAQCRDPSRLKAKAYSGEPGSLGA